MSNTIRTKRSKQKTSFSSGTLRLLDPEDQMRRYYTGPATVIGISTDKDQGLVLLAVYRRDGGTLIPCLDEIDADETDDLDDVTGVGHA